MKNVQLEDDQVSTLAELAETVANSYGWISYEVGDHEIYFKAQADGEEVNGRLEPSGFAYDVDSGEPIDEWDVNWDEIFDGWSNHVWALDGEGRTVMVHD